MKRRSIQAQAVEALLVSLLSLFLVPTYLVVRSALISCLPFISCANYVVVCSPCTFSVLRILYACHAVRFPQRRRERAVSSRSLLSSFQPSDSGTVLEGLPQSVLFGAPVHAVAGVLYVAARPQTLS